MPNEFLLDTNIAIAFQAGEQNVVGRVVRAAIYVPAVVIGELFYGAYDSVRLTDNVAAVDRLAKMVSVLACDYETARQYGLIKASLRVRGKMIPENDIWIAAVAKQHDLTLVTRDAHFAHLSDLLRTEAW